MSLLLILLIVLILFGGGSYFYDGGAYRGSLFPGIGGIILLLVILSLFGVIHL